ncbi:unnamed protein product [Prorocentrum cordatum]|uniref:Uncharacterized protein n=1 Tax=Prorocentrum cordatum TaxID=2364126 RepID=A0ABN9VJM1_9DINO|nr:unnamed protein product [Polarella glacialis]
MMHCGEIHCSVATSSIVPISLAWPPSARMPHARSRPFFVSESDGRQRPVSDTRKLSACFCEPAAAEVPAAGARGGLRARECDGLAVEQVDVEAALHRMRAPAGRPTRVHGSPWRRRGRLFGR